MERGISHVMTRSQVRMDQEDANVRITNVENQLAQIAAMLAEMKVAASHATNEALPMATSPLELQIDDHTYRE